MRTRISFAHKHLEGVSRNVLARGGFQRVDERRHLAVRRVWRRGGELLLPRWPWTHRHVQDLSLAFEEE